MTAEISNADLIHWCDRQKKGEIYIVVLDVMDSGYRLHYTEEFTNTEAERSGMSPQIAKNAEPSKGLDRDRNKPLMKNGTANVVPPPIGNTCGDNLNSDDDIALSNVAVVQEQKNTVPAGKTLSGDSGLKPDSNSICPACLTRHLKETECDLTALSKRFEPIAAKARVIRENCPF